MDPRELLPVVETVWVWVAAPLLTVAAIVYTIRLKLPQVSKLGAAFRGLKTHDEDAPGTVHPATSVAMATVAAYGAAAAVGAATAVSLGGPGAIAWVWLFSILLAPLRMGEAVLARTAPPGEAGESTGTLAGRLLDDPVGGLRFIGWALLILVPLAAFAFFGGTHGEAVLDAAEQLLPGSALTLGLVVAGVGAALALMPSEKAGSTLGWIAAVSLIALFGAGLVAFLSDPGRGFGGFGRAVVDVFEGAPNAGAWSGALAGEIAMAAMIHLLPPLAAAGGIDGAWQAEAQAETTRKHAATALLGPIFYGVLTTFLGLSLVATNAFARPIEATQPLEELTFYRVGFDTVSQRLEDDRLYTGFVRVVDGDTGVVDVDLATPRGMVRAATFEDAGEPANVAMHVRAGGVDNLQKPGRLGALQTRPLAELDRVQVHGQMLPTGGKLLAASMTRAGGDILSRVALAALLMLAALGIAAWGLGVAKTLRCKLPKAVARWTAVLPAAGLAVATLGVVRGFGTLGLLIAGVLAAVSSIALIVRARDAAKLLAGSGK